MQDQCAKSNKFVEAELCKQRIEAFKKKEKERMVEQLKQMHEEQTNQLDIEKRIAELNDFEFVGMVGIIDPPRDGIFDVMQQCKLAGMKVFMVTGDFSLTAAAIARKVGIFSSVQPDLLENVRNNHQKKHDWGKLRSDAANSLMRYFGSINSGSIGWCYGTPYQQGEYCKPDQAKVGQLPWLKPDHTPKDTCP